MFGESPNLVSPGLTEASVGFLSLVDLRVAIAKLQVYFSTRRALHGLNYLTTIFEIKLSKLLIIKNKKTYKLNYTKSNLWAKNV